MAPTSDRATGLPTSPGSHQLRARLSRLIGRLLTRDERASARDRESQRIAAVRNFNCGVLMEEEGLAGAAAAAYERARQSGDGDVAPKAGFNLAVLLASHGAMHEAASLYRDVIKSRHPDAAAKAAFNYARLCEDRGDDAGARAAYAEAAHSQHLDVGPNAARRLELLDAAQTPRRSVRASEQAPCARRWRSASSSRRKSPRLGHSRRRPQRPSRP